MNTATVANQVTDCIGPPGRLTVYAGHITGIQREFLDLFEASRCNISRTCHALAIEREQFNQWLTGHDFAAAVHDMEQGLIDDVWANLYSQAMGGNVRAVMFYLDHKAQGRGYGKPISHTETVTIRTDSTRAHTSQNVSFAGSGKQVH